MLRKILKIKNVGRFEDCKWRGGSQFESMTLIYGENSRGKSTFCNILRSCQSNSPDCILGRKRLGATGDCEVELRTDTANLNFSKGTWSGSLSSLAIFDTTFVHQNIFAGDKIDHDQKKNLYRVIVGEKGVTLAKIVDDLDVAIREAAKDVGANRAVLEARLPKGTDLKVFIKQPVVDDFKAKIAAVGSELKAAETAQTKAVLIQTKANLQEIAAPQSLEMIAGLLAENLPGIAADAEKNLREHLAIPKTPGGGLPMAGGLGVGAATSPPRMKQKSPALGGAFPILLFIYSSHGANWLSVSPASSFVVFG